MRRPRKKPTAHDWAPYRAEERAIRPSPHAPYRLALAYPNTYEVGMSSLGFQRVYEQVHDEPEWCCERFFTNGKTMPRSVETDTPLNDFGCIAFSVSFDYVHCSRCWIVLVFLFVAATGALGTP